MKGDKGKEEGERKLKGKGTDVEKGRERLERKKKEKRE
jgi:hypothetical protein